MADPVATLATALGGYIDDIERDCRECLQEESVATVTDTGGNLRLSWAIPCKRATIAHLREVIDGLPGWKESHFWTSDRPRLEALENRSWTGVMVSGPEAVVRRGISWVGRPVLVEAIPITRGKQMVLELLLPAVYREWPELPLRPVADAVRCYRVLVPDDLVRALPRSSLPATGAESIGQFLTRTMPSNLYASQCFALRLEQN